MSVEYYIVCLNHYEILHVGTSLSIAEQKLIEKMIKKKVTLDEILEGCSSCIKDFIRELINTSVISDVVRFIERHKECKKIYLWNDMMEIDGFGFLPDVVWEEEPDVKRNLERIKYNMDIYAPLILCDDVIERYVCFDFNVPKEIEEYADKQIKVVEVLEDKEKLIVKGEDGKIYDCTGGKCIECGQK